MTISSISKFMDESLLRGSSISFSQHQEYNPLIDELVFYVTQWYEQADEGKKVSTNEEA